MNVNKKLFIIIGTVLISLILIILIIIVALGGRHEQQTIQFSMNNTTSNNIVQNNTFENETENNVNNITNSTSEENTITGEITYVETSDGGRIPVPPTFEYIEGDSSTGAIIKDANDNEFVWVPVNNSSDYQRQIFINNGDGITTEDIEELNLNDATNQDYIDSIMNYKGFYVARYETGKEDETDTPVSKKGVIPWTMVVWEKAKDIATQMYTENDYFQTDLISSYAWDTVCNWMRNTGTNIDDSTNYGNYQNSIDGLNRVVETGSNERWKVNNIYDMAGNVWEYTTEEYGNHEKYHMGRGGGYWNYGNLYPISTRGTSEDAADINIGFRIVMYLK